jgi:hypothetical protein
VPLQEQVELVGELELVVLGVLVLQLAAVGIDPRFNQASH